MRIWAFCYILLLPGLLWAQQRTTTYYDITEFGAVEGGEQLCTQAIQQAIDACASAGGGQVYVPAGIFLTGTLIVKSNVNLHIESGAVLVGSPNMSDYDERHPHLIYARDVTNFTLTGRGKIDGQGPRFYNRGGTSWTPKAQRPVPWIMIQNSERIQIRDVLFSNTPSNTLVLIGCKAILIDGITIENNKLSSASNGIDINNCSFVQVNNCFIQTGGDAITLQSKTNVVEQVIVTNCILSSEAAAINFGTASALAIRNCVFSNLSIFDSRYGIALMMVDGGVFEQTIFENMIIDTGSKRGVEYPIFIDIHKRDASSRLGRISNLLFKNISIVTEGNVLISGQKNATIEYIDFENVTMTVKDVSSLARAKKPTVELLGSLAGLDDYADVPALFIFANIEHLNLSNVKLFFEYKKLPYLDRHALYFNNVEHALIDRFQGRQAQYDGRVPTILCVNSSDLTIVNSTAAEGTHQFLAHEGCEDILMNVENNNLRNAKVQN